MTTQKKIFKLISPMQEDFRYYTGNLFPRGLPGGREDWADDSLSGHALGTVRCPYWIDLEYAVSDLCFLTSKAKLE